MITQTKHRFGGCPECGGNDGFFQLHPDAWFICHMDKTSWKVSAAILCTRLEQTEYDYHQNWLALDHYHNVEPMPWLPTFREWVRLWRDEWPILTREWLRLRRKLKHDTEIPF